ncbi:MAG: hypothetical protein GY861_14040 [bacterium]|nr:hypothetical protein [bacterium]
MRKLFIILFILSNILTWYITKLNVEPERIVITQEKQIIKYREKIKRIEAVEKNERFLFIFKKGELLWGIGGYLFGVL